MLDLVLFIVISSLLFVIFKLFEVYKVQTLYAIIVNYTVASLVGLLFFEGDVTLSEMVLKPWLPYTVALGLLFIVVFNLTGRTSQQMGVSVASVASKMSLVIPVLFGIVLYHEQLSFLTILGVLMALAAVYFTSVKEESIALKTTSIALPLLLFIGSGLIDASIKLLQERFMQSADFALFSSTVFGAAALFGILLVFLRSFVTPLKVNFRNVLGGIALGIPNYFSIFFLLRALQYKGLSSASLFTIANVAVVLLSTLLGILLFKEKLSLKNWGGIALAVFSIVLVILF